MTRNARKFASFAMIFAAGLAAFCAQAQEAAQPAPEAQPAAAATAPPAENAAPTPARVTLPAEEGALLAAIEGQKDLFALYDMQEEYGKSGQSSEAVTAAFTKKRDQLVEKYKKQTAIDGCLDFVAFDFKNVKGNEHEARWYFVVTEDIKENWNFKLSGKVDALHASRLPESDRANGMTIWRIRPSESNITSWKKGEHRVISMKISLQQIPYNLSSQFYQWFPDKPQVSGKLIEHGWRAFLE